MEALSERGQTEEYPKDEGSWFSSGEKNSEHRKSQTPRAMPKDYRRGRGWEIALGFSHRTVTAPRNNKSSVCVVRQRVHAPIYGSLWQPLANTRREIPEAQGALYTRVSLSLSLSVSFFTCLPYFGFSKARLFCDLLAYLPLLDLFTLVDLCSHYPTRRDLFELIRATSRILCACPLILVRSEVPVVLRIAHLHLFARGFDYFYKATFNEAFLIILNC